MDRESDGPAGIKEMNSATDFKLMLSNIFLS